ncbi:MAG: DUF1905 domain-containing protein [Chitinophagaceae bacterium]|nr:DUF1905 domain-containing protein [Chitinophagaceae bacterium]
MIVFTTILKKFDEQGEKTGWTYIDIPARTAALLKPGNKKSFRVKGRLDEYSFTGLALIPMGNGNFIMAINATIRKAIHKKNGAMLKVQLEPDNKPYKPDKEFIQCLNDDPAAKKFFESLPAGHRNYFSKWIEAVKTEPTKTKRIANAVNALSKGFGFTQMSRSFKEQNDLF